MGIKKGSFLGHRKIYLKLVLLAALVVVLNGCVLLEIPGRIIGGTFDLLGKLLGVIDKMPKPPPGVFF